MVEFDRAQQTTLQAAGVTIVSPGVRPGVGSSQPAVAAPNRNLGLIGTRVVIHQVSPARSEEGSQRRVESKDAPLRSP